MALWRPGLARRLEELEKRVEAMETDYERVTGLEADWQDWQHKIRNVLARLNQRDRAAEEAVELSNGPRRQPVTMNPAARRLLGFPEE